MERRENIYLRKDGCFEARYVKERYNAGKLIYNFCYGRTYEEAREKAQYAGSVLARDIGRSDLEEYAFDYYCDSWLIPPD